MKIKLFLSVLFLNLLIASKALSDGVLTDRCYKWAMTGCVEYDCVNWLGKLYLYDPSYNILVPNAFISIYGEYNNILAHSIDFDLLNLKKNKIAESSIIFFYNNKFNIKLGFFYPKMNTQDLSYSVNKILKDNLIISSKTNNMDFTTTFNYKNNNYNIFFSIAGNKYSLRQEIFRFKHFSYYLRAFKYFNFNNKYKTHIGLTINNVSYFNGVDNTGTQMQFLDSYEIYPSLRTYPSNLLKYIAYGVEFINLYNSFVFQFEYQDIHAYWRDFEKERYKNFYVQFLMPLYGDERKYDFNTGSLLRRNNLIADNSLELVLRYSYINITNKGFMLQRLSTLDGKKKTLMLGLNWYPHEKIRVQFSYMKESSKRRVTEYNFVSTAYGMKLQFIF